jgi:glycine dehydrogenase subunit 2
MDKNQSTGLLFEISRPGRRAHRVGAPDVPEIPLETLFPGEVLAETPPALPELAELDVVRHFTNLSSKNMAIDCNFYPLGSCTMKYNPKLHERIVALPGFGAIHPLAPDSVSQGILELLYGMQKILAEIAGLPAVSIQPAAGAQGELTALLVAAAYFRHKKDYRTRVLIPDSAHGTNPASAALAGFEAVTVKSRADGLVDFEDLKLKVDNRTAVFMITNPNTLGLFDGQIAEITKLIHDAGGLVYLDGANMNAILGITRPGDFGADMMHYNVHKTFTGPHGAGGPGSGPIAVRDFLEPFLPSPVVVKTNNGYALDFDRSLSIGRVHGFQGNIGVLVRGYAYILTLGPKGLREVSEQAVLNANYLLALLKDAIEVPKGDRCMHEFVASARLLRREKRISAMDICKGLLDHGYHPPTVYFPLVVPEALMMEPTETESKETLEEYAKVFKAILAESAETLHHAPHTLGISRPDEVAAAKTPVLRWKN